MLHCWTNCSRACTGIASPMQSRLAHTSRVDLAPQIADAEKPTFRMANQWLHRFEPDVVPKDEARASSHVFFPFGFDLLLVLTGNPIAPTNLCFSSNKFSE